MTGSAPGSRATRVYAVLVRLYPKAHRERFGAQMRRTFEDSYRDARRSPSGPGVAFWVGTILDELRGITREHLEAGGSPRGLLRRWPYAALLLGMAPCWFAASWITWSVLALPVALLAILFLAVGRHSSSPAKLLMLVVALGAVMATGMLARYTSDPLDLLPPILLIVGLSFLAKSTSAIHAKSAGEVAVHGRIERQGTALDLQGRSPEGARLAVDTSGRVFERHGSRLVARPGRRPHVEEWQQI